MASLLDWFGDIGKKLHGVEAQLNPWDNGETYDSVVNGAPRQVARPQNRVQQPRLQSSSNTTNPFNTSFDNTRLPNTPAPKIDINANAQLSQSQQQKQPQHDFLKDAGNFINDNIVKPVKEDVSKAYNTVAAPITGLTGAATVAADDLFNGGRNADNLAAATKAAVDENVRNSFVPQNVAQGTATPTQFANEFAKTGIRLAPYFVNPGGGALTSKFGSTVASGIGNDLARKVAGKGVESAANAAVSAPIFASLNAGQQALESGFHSFDPRQAIRAGLQGGAMTLGGNLAGDLLHGGVRAGVNRVNEITSQPGYNSQYGFIAGPGATGFPEAQANGRVFKGIDDMPRFEVDDSGAKLNREGMSNPYDMTLEKVLSHPNLYEQYPGLRSTPVEFDPSTGAIGYFDGKTINVHPGGSDEQIKNTILHEVQHAIQGREGFAGGGSPSEAAYELGKVNKERVAQGKPPLTSHEAYRHLAGEAEARAVQARMNMPDSERYIQPKSAKEYGMSHRPDDEGPRLFDMTEGDMLPKDYYDHPDWYGYNPRQSWDRESLTAVMKARNNPDAEVTIYRAGPKNELNSGDWVGLSKDYATQHVREAGEKVHKFKVKAKDLRFAGDDINEFGYFPENQKPRSTFYDSLDIPKNELIVRKNGEGKAMSLEPGKPKKQPTQSRASQRVLDAFNQSTNQRELANVNGVKFELGTFGENAAKRKAAKHDRLDASELSETLKNIKQAYRSSDNPRSYRSENIAWVAEMPDGEKRVVYTRKNARGGEEIINWHRLNKEKSSDYIASLKKFGTPARSRTGNFGLERLAGNPPHGSIKSEDRLESELHSHSTMTKNGKNVNGDGLDTVESQYLREQVASHKSPQEFVDNMVDTIWQANKKGSGVDSVLIPDEVGGGYNKRVSVSNNSRFYQDFYAEYGRAPTKTAIKDMVEQHLGVKKDSNYKDLLTEEYTSPVDADIYHALKERQDRFDALSRYDARASDSISPRVPSSLRQLKAHSSLPRPKGQSRVVPRANTTSKSQFVSNDVAVGHSKNVSKSPGLPQKRTPGGRETLQSRGSQPYPQTTRDKGFAQSVKKSNEVSDTVKKRVGGTYTTRNTQKMIDKSEDFTKRNLSKAVDSVVASLNRKKGKLSDQEISNAITVAKRLDANKNHSLASDIYEKIGDHLTALGRAVQAASVLSNRTPEGLHYGAIRELKKHGVEITPEISKQISAKIKEIKEAKPKSLERNLHIKELQKIVADHIPSDRADKITGIWKAGLLSGLRTQTGNALSNETFSDLHNVSNIGAAGLDKLISLKTGERTKTLTTKGLLKGTGEGFRQAKRYFKTGIDERSPLTNKYSTRQLNFKNKAINGYVNGIFRLMGAADRPHYYRQLRNSLYDIGKADGLNKGLKGEALRKHVEEFVANPPEDKFQLATNEAEKAVLANDTLLSKLAGRVQKAADEAESPIGRFAAKVAVSGVAPFTKVPSAFISRVIDYTPVGALKEIATQISRKHFDQRALVTAISEAGTGTGLMWLGSQLAANNLISGNYPDDPKEQQRWKAQGIQPNSVKVGDNWYSMNYFGPIGLLFAAGARINDAKEQGGGFFAQQGSAYGGIPKDLTEQSFLQGLNNSIEAINEPGRYANNWLKSNAGSVIPTLSNDIATAIDSKQRQSDSPLETIVSRVPGVRQLLKPAQDVYGNDLDRKTDPIDTLINPLRPSKTMTNAVKSEVERLHNADPNNSDLQVTPTPVDKSLTVDGKNVSITSKQRYDLQKAVGQSTQSAWGSLMKTSQYKALSDTDKASALEKLRKDVTAVVTSKYMSQNNLGNKKLTTRQQALANGAISFDNYTTDSSSGGITIASGLSQASTDVLTKYNSLTAQQREAWFNKDNAAEYDYYKAKYDNDKASGSINSIEDIKRKKTLAKDKVGSVYPKTVRDLYGLSKANTYAYLTTAEKGVDKKKLGDQLIAYDKALYNAGLTSYLKFKNGLAPASKGSSRKGGSKKKSSGIDQESIRELAYRSKVPTYKAPPKGSASVVAAPALKKTTLRHYTPRIPTRPKVVAK